MIILIFAILFITMVFSAVSATLRWLFLREADLLLDLQIGFWIAVIVMTAISLL